MLYFQQFCECPRGCCARCRSAGRLVIERREGIMRSERAAHSGPDAPLRPRAVFLFGHTSRLGGTRPRTRFYEERAGKMYNVPVARKVCATCKWWRGKREVNFIGAREPQFITVAGLIPGSKCAAWKVERSATHACNRWVKWERM